MILLVANKYSPQNFWNGRWRSAYILNPSSNSLHGTIKVDVHYYEDGNVRMSTSKQVEVGSAGSAEVAVREIAKAENKFQEELNRAFVNLAEGSFKGLRRQLPVTRQRVEWEKIGGYRVCAYALGFDGMPAWIWSGSTANIVAVGSRHWRWSLEVEHCHVHAALRRNMEETADSRRMSAGAYTASYHHVMPQAASLTTKPVESPCEEHYKYLHFLVICGHRLIVIFLLAVLYSTDHFLHVDTLSGRYPSIPAFTWTGSTAKDSSL